MNELALFAGAGGGLLGTRLLGWRTVCYVEKDRYAVKVIKARIRDGYLDDAPIWDDANSFDGRPWLGLVDVITAGFPCQPFSIAGKGLAEADPRNGWPATIRIIREVRPRHVFLENVPALLAKEYFGAILGELAESGYAARWDCLSAASVGAPHERDRLWIVAHADSEPVNVSEQSREKGVDTARNGEQEQVADANGGRLAASNEEKRKFPIVDENGYVSDSGGVRKVSGLCASAKDERRSSDQRDGAEINGRGQWWEAEPDVGRVADGVAARVDRLKAIGNGQVPAVVREAWMLLSDL